MDPIVEYLTTSKCTELAVWEANGVAAAYPFGEAVAKTAVAKKRKRRQEHALQEAVYEALLLDGYVVIWVNSGAQKIGNRFVIFNRWQVAGDMGQTGGVSDLIAVGHGRTLFLETKTATGRLSPKQKKFGAAVEAAGGTYVVVREMGDIRPFLKNLDI